MLANRSPDEPEELSSTGSEVAEECVVLAEENLENAGEKRESRLLYQRAIGNLELHGKFCADSALWRGLLNSIEVLTGNFIHQKELRYASVA